MEEIKLHLGCGWRNFGKDWIHVDNGDYNHLDYNCNVSLLPFNNNFADIIYASHVIGYFDRDEIIDVFKEWYRVLKPNGVLRIATPDIESISNLYNNKNYQIENFLGPIFGKMKMGNNIIYHKTIYDFDSLKNILNGINFKNVKKYDWRNTDHSQFDDHSQSYLPHMNKKNGQLISLNIECNKYEN